MKLSAVTALAVPFVLLLALLASIVIAPRLHSTPVNHALVGTYSTHVADLPTTIITAYQHAARHGGALRNTPPLAMDWPGQSMMSCAWPVGTLRMPYYSFADSFVNQNGI